VEEFDNHKAAGPTLTPPWWRLPLARCRWASRAEASLVLAGHSPTGWSTGVEISCRVYKPRQARESPLFGLLEQCARLLATPSRRTSRASSHPRPPPRPSPLLRPHANHVRGERPGEEKPRPADEPDAPTRRRCSPSWARQPAREAACPGAKPCRYTPSRGQRRRTAGRAQGPHRSSPGSATRPGATPGRLTSSASIWVGRAPRP